MKKSLIFGAMASAMLFATSCQEDFQVVETGSEAVVSFNLTTPQIATRAYSDGTTATNLQYAVYKNVTNANGEVELQYLENLTRTDEVLEGLKQKVNLKLTTGDTYTVVFWAASPYSPYTANFGTKTLHVDYTNILSNDESLDAFFNDTTFTVTGSVAMDVELRRPFAQLNIGTSDWQDAANSGYEVDQTAVTVSNVYSTLSLVGNEDGTHTVSNPVKNLTFNLTYIPNEDVDGPFPVAGYKYLSMNYLLVPDEKEVLSQVTLTYNSTDGNSKTRTFGQIPVQRNYRTNIYGQLLTSNVDVYVEIIPEYYEPDFDEPVSDTPGSDFDIFADLSYDDMVYVAGGTFLMGAQSTDPNAPGYDSAAVDDESPVHSVTVSSFYIGKYEVTQELWEYVMGNNPSYYKDDNLPVERVSWDDCQVFITKLNELTGKSFRLPTEAEWEYAARGGKNSKGYKYSGSNTIGDVAWYGGNSSSTHPVGTKQPNELGLYDMTGNVSEWCQDWSGSYSSYSQTDPTGPSSGTYRVRRGRSFITLAWYCQVSSRESHLPSSRGRTTGFRLVCEE